MSYLFGIVQTSISFDGVNVCSSRYSSIWVTMFGFPNQSSTFKTASLLSSLWRAQWPLILIFSHRLFHYKPLEGSCIAPDCSYAVASAHAGPFAAFWCNIHWHFSPASSSRSTFHFHRVRQTHSTVTLNGLIVVTGSSFEVHTNGSTKYMALHFMHLIQYII